MFDGLADLGFALLDVEQVQVHGRLLLSVELGGSTGRTGRTGRTGNVQSAGTGSEPDMRSVDRVRRALQGALGDWLGGGPGDLQLAVVALEGAGVTGDAGPLQCHLVTVLAPRLEAGTMAGICRHIAACGGNVDRVVRLSTYPVTSYELVVSGGEPDRLRRELGAEAARLEVDVAVQRAGLHRRAKHLVVLDADSTLLRGEVIDLLAQKAGCAAEVASVTAAAMAGDLDFTESLALRLELLAGTELSLLEEVAGEIVLTPGARTLVRTLKRLGYATAVVSGGFVQVIDKIAVDLGIDQVAANTLEVVDGRLTGRLLGPIIDRAGKAAALVRFAELTGVPISLTIAIGDGANDVDMLATAGLGIAFNAKPMVRSAADTALNVPYLDAVLFLLGISRQEVEAADFEE